MYPPPQFCEARLLLSFQLGDALLDGDDFLPQVLQVSLKISDDLLSGPETPSEMAWRAAATGTGATVMMVPVPASMVPTTSTIHNLTSFLLSIC